MNPGYGLEISSGTVLGASGTVGFGRASLAVTTQTGVLTATTGPDLEREVAEIGLALGYHVLEGLALEGGVQVRAYTVPLGSQRWTMFRIGAAALVPVAIDGVALAGRAAFKPAVSVTGGADIRLALEGSAGLEFTRGRFSGALVYTRERYDFTETATGERLEQVAGVTARIGVTLVRSRR